MMLNQKMRDGKRQLGFKFRAWGGKGKGGGGKPKGGKAGGWHERGTMLKGRFPVDVAGGIEGGGWKLRWRRCFGALGRAFWGGANRFGFRLVHYSVQGNHVHLLVEAEDERALSRGMNGLGVRMARGLNRVMGRTGKVLADRYHARILR